ncbi:MAG TPA: hypothetical protein VK062_01420 [Burkholderiaceae bacterium]|nr:hypothetical protein [Burkholderiaceae bacterium]
MIKAEITGELLDTPEPRQTNSGAEFTVCRVLAACFRSEPCVLHVVSWQQTEGERLRKLKEGDPVHLKGHLTVKRTEGQPAAVGLNVRKVLPIESKL